MKDTFDKVVMDEDKKAEIRYALQTNSHKRRKVWLAPVLGLAMTVAVLMAVPYTRKSIVRAAEKVVSVFKSQPSAIYVSESDADVVFEITAEPGGVLNVKVKDDRLFLVIDEEWIDITDKCSDTDFYRYEIPYDDGTKDVLFIGGTVNNYGWLEIRQSKDSHDDVHTVSIVHADPEAQWLKNAYASEKFEQADVQLELPNDN